MAKAKAQAPPTSKLARSGVVGKTLARAALKKAGALGRRPFVDAERAAVLEERADREIAEEIFEALSTLRGAALKAAQLFAMELELIDASLRQELAKAHSEVPPINRALARKLVKAALGAPEERFARFEQRPFAAASLGQVHAATHHDGRELAVKLQYPGIGESITSDLKLLRTLLAPSRYSRIFASCFDEVAERLAEEIDYEREAESTETFALRNEDPMLVFPQVVPELSCRTVLTTTRLQGQHLEAWLATGPTQELRDHYGQLLVDTFHRDLFVHGLIHADPNPGNYLFMADGRLGILDFGCVKALPRDFRAALALLLYGNGDHVGAARGEREVELHERIGVHYCSDPRSDGGNDTFIDRWLGWVAAPYRVATFDFDADGAAYFNDGKALLGELYRRIDHYDPVFLYFGRADHGLLRLLQRLGARVRMRPNGSLVEGLFAN